jgi:hypothetical protein
MDEFADAVCDRVSLTGKLELFTALPAFTWVLDGDGALLVGSVA